MSIIHNSFPNIFLGLKFQDSKKIVKNNFPKFYFLSIEIGIFKNFKIHIVSSKGGSSKYEKLFPLFKNAISAFSFRGFFFEIGLVRSYCAFFVIQQLRFFRDDLW